MKKIIITGAVILVTAIVSMPYVMGVVAEKATRNIVNNINQDSEIYGNTEIADYQRSYKSTQSSYKYSPPSSFVDIGWDFGDIEYKCEADHGVFSYTYVCKLASNGSYNEFVNEHLGGKDPFSIRGNVTLLGKLTQVIQLDAFEINKDGEKLTVGLAVIEAITDRNLRDYKMTGEFAGMSLTEGDTLSTIGEATLNGDIYIAKDKFQFGTINFDISNVDLKSPSESNLTVNDLALEVNSKEQGDTVSIDYLVKAKEFLLTKDTESYDLDKVSLGFEAKGLDRTALVELNELLKEMSKQSGEVTPEQSFKALPLVEAMLRKGLALSFNLSTNFEGQEFNSKFNTRLIDKLTMAELSFLALDPESALDKLALSTSTVIPDSIIRKQPSMSFVLSNSPFFQQAENGFKNDLVVEKDNIKLNGEKLSLNDLIAMVMQSVPQ